MKELCVIEQCCGPGAPMLPPGAADALAARFKALADPARISIVNRLSGAGEVCTCELTEPLGLSQPTVSHHLRILKESGLVEVARRRGTWTHYRLVPGAFEQLAATLSPPAGLSAA